MDMLTAMRVFVKVVDAGSLSTAARELGMGQATISERLARLEAHLGQTLIERTTRTSRLTGTGRTFYDRSKRVIEAATIAESVSGQQPPMSGKVSVTAPAWIGEMILPALLVRFRRQHPGLEVELLIGDTGNPALGESDATIFLGELPAGACTSEEIGSLQRILVASPDYLHAFGAPSAPDELILHSFVMAAGVFDGTGIPLIGADGAELAAVNIGWSLPHWRPLLAMLEAGAGIGFIHAGAAAEALASGRLVHVLPGYSLPAEAVHLAHAADGELAPNARLITDFLGAALRSHAAFAPQDFARTDPALAQAAAHA